MVMNPAIVKVGGRVVVMVKDRSTERARGKPRARARVCFASLG